MTVVSVQGAVGAVIARWGKRCCVCGEDVGAMGVVEAIVVIRLNWLVAVVALMVKRLGVGCCGGFQKAL